MYNDSKHFLKSIKVVCVCVSEQAEDEWASRSERLENEINYPQACVIVQTGILRVSIPL